MGQALEQEGNVVRGMWKQVDAVASGRYIHTTLGKVLPVYGSYYGVIRYYGSAVAPCAPAAPSREGEVVGGRALPQYSERCRHSSRTRADLDEPMALRRKGKRPVRISTRGRRASSTTTLREE